jgi:hypothetical protein
MESEIRRVSDRVFGGNRPRHQDRKRGEQDGPEFSLEDAQQPTAPAKSALELTDHIHGRRIKGEREIGGRLDVTA